MHAKIQLSTGILSQVVSKLGEIAAPGSTNEFQLYFYTEVKKTENKNFRVPFTVARKKKQEKSRT